MTTKQLIATILNNRHISAVGFTDEDIIVTLSDDTKISNPLNWHPWLHRATSEQRQDYELYSDAIFWLDLDEGIDVEGMLRGIRPRIRHSKSE